MTTQYNELFAYLPESGLLCGFGSYSRLEFAAKPVSSERSRIYRRRKMSEDGANFRQPSKFLHQGMFLEPKLEKLQCSAYIRRNAPVEPNINYKWSVKGSTDPLGDDGLEREVHGLSFFSGWQAEHLPSDIPLVGMSQVQLSLRCFMKETLMDPYDICSDYHHHRWRASAFFRQKSLWLMRYTMAILITREACHLPGLI